MLGELVARKTTSHTRTHNNGLFPLGVDEYMGERGRENQSVKCYVSAWTGAFALLARAFGVTLKIDRKLQETNEQAER